MIHGMRSDGCAWIAFPSRRLVLIITGPIAHSLSQVKPVDPRILELQGGAAEQSDGFCQFSLRGQDLAQIVLGGDEVRPEGERPPIARHRVIEPV